MRVNLRISNRLIPLREKVDRTIEKGIVDAIGRKIRDSVDQTNKKQRDDQP